MHSALLYPTVEPLKPYKNTQTHPIQIIIFLYYPSISCVCLFRLALSLSSTIVRWVVFGSHETIVKGGHNDTDCGSTNVSDNEFVVNLGMLVVPLAQFVSKLQFPLDPFRRLLQLPNASLPPTAVSRSATGSCHINPKINDFVYNLSRFDLNNTE